MTRLGAPSWPAGHWLARWSQPTTREGVHSRVPHTQAPHWPAARLTLSHASGAVALATGRREDCHMGYLATPGEERPRLDRDPSGRSGPRTVTC